MALAVKQLALYIIFLTVGLVYVLITAALLEMLSIFFAGMLVISMRIILIFVATFCFINLWMRVVVSFVLIIIENLPIIQSIKQSWELARGRVWFMCRYFICFALFHIAVFGLFYYSSHHHWLEFIEQFIGMGHRGLVIIINRLFSATFSAGIGMPLSIVYSLIIMQILQRMQKAEQGKINSGGK